MLSNNFGVEIPDTVNNAIGVVQDFIAKGQEVVDFLLGTASNAIGNIKEKIAENEATFQGVIDLADSLKDKLFEAFEHAKPTIAGTVAVKVASPPGWTS